MEIEEPDTKDLSKKDLAKKSMIAIDMILIHMSRNVTNIDVQRTSREVIRGHLNVIRESFGLPPATATKLFSGACPFCQRRIGVTGPKPKERVASFLDKRRNMKACAYCGTEQNRAKRVGESCDKADCTAIVVEYFKRPTWIPTPR